MTGTLLVNHCGLGDMLIANGLVRCLVADPDVPLPLTVLYKQEYTADAEQNWRDLIIGGEVRLHCLTPPWIYEEAIAMKGQEWERVIDISGFSGANPGWGRGETFDESMYRLAGVPHEEKWNSFHAPRHPLEYPHPEGVILVHDDINREMRIDYRKIPQGVRTHIDMLGAPTLFHARHIIESAAEIHCIDSSVANFVDLLGVSCPKYLHAYARTTDFMPKFHSDWQIYG